LHCRRENRVGGLLGEKRHRLQYECTRDVGAQSSTRRKLKACHEADPRQRVEAFSCIAQQAQPAMSTQRASGPDRCAKNLSIFLIYMCHNQLTGDFMKHGVVLPTEKSLCGLPSHELQGGYIFTEVDMRLRKGQQYNIFRDSVECPDCLEVGKTLVDNICSSCGTKLE